MANVIRTYKFDTDIPVQRNYLTTIMGNVLTTATEFTITIDEAFQGTIDSDLEGNSTTKGFAVTSNGETSLFSTLDEALAVVTTGDIITISTAGTYQLPAEIKLNGSSTGSLTFKGNGDNTILKFGPAGGADGGLNCYADGIDLVFENLKIESPAHTAYTGGFGRAASVLFENCNYVGQYRNMGPTSFINCTIDPENSYIYTDYSDCTFDGCTFNCSGGKGIQVYNDGTTTNTTIDIKNCTFTAAKQAQTWDGKPVTAIDINSNGEKFTVNIENTTTTGFPNGLFSGNGLWNIKGGAENVTITIDGKKVEYITVDGTLYGNIKDAVGATAAGETLNIPAGTYTMPTNFAEGVTLVCDNAVFEGTSSLNINGSTIIGATFSSDNERTATGTINGTFKSCTFEGNRALRYCYAGETTVFEDCIFDGSVYGAHFDGGANDITFSGCSLSGFNAFGAAITQLTLENCKFVCTGKSNYNGVNLWGATKLVGCEFTFDGKAATEWIGLNGADSKVIEFENCTINGEALTMETAKAYFNNYVAGAKVTIDGVEYTLE